MLSLSSTRLWRRRTAIVAALVAAVAVAGIAYAAGEMPAPSSSAAAPETPLSPLETLAAFQRSATPAERALSREPKIRAAVVQLTDDDPAVPAEFRAGAARKDLRVLLSELGTGGRAIYAFTTAKNRVCLGLTDFTSGCYSGLPLGAAVDVTVGDPDAEGSGEPPLVWGLARNDVRRIDVEVGGQTYPATFARNAYFFQLTDSSVSTSAITAVVVKRADGTVQRIPVP